MRQRFLRDVGGTLRFTPPEADALGAPASGTVTLKRASGLDLPVPVVDQAAVVAGNDLTFALVAANAPDPLTHGYLYRAAWTYVISGATYRADHLYEVRRRILKPTLTVSELVRRLPATLQELTGDATTDTAIDAIGDAWDDLLDELTGRGYEPDKIMDPDRLRGAHRELTLAVFGKSWGPQWREWSTARETDFKAKLADALASDGWYDKDQSSTQDAGEVRTARITCTR